MSNVECVYELKEVHRKWVWERRDSNRVKENASTYTRARMKKWDVIKVKS